MFEPTTYTYDPSRVRRGTTDNNARTSRFKIVIIFIIYGSITAIIVLGRMGVFIPSR